MSAGEAAVTATPTLLGRARELTVLEHHLDRGREHGGGVLITGEAGIGKTSLLAAAGTAARARGCTVLSVCGLQSEADLPWAGLHRLLQPVLSLAARLPGPQRAALLGAFGMSDGATAGPVLTGLGTLGLLSECATGAPLLLLVDDAHWLDAETRAVLAFVARRIESDPVVIVASQRPGEPSGLDDTGLTALDVGALSDDDSATLLDARAPGLDPAQRAHILSLAAGNPLALTELPAVVDATTGTTGSAVRLTTRLERSFTARLRSVAPAARTLLLVAALDDADDLGEILAAAATLPTPAQVADLDAALATTLIAVDDGHLRFRHPLIRSAVVADAPPAAQRAAHAALAAVLTGRPDRRAWHRARAAGHADAEVAAELEAVATEARRRGGITTALRVQEESARLTPQPHVRASRLLAAAEMAFDAGSEDTMRRLLDEAQRLGLAGAESRRAMWVGELFDEGRPGDAEHVRLLVETAGAAAHDGDADLCVNLLVSAAALCWWADPGEAARAQVVGAVQRHLGHDDPRALALLGIADPIAHAAAVTAGLAAVSIPDDANPQDLRLLGMGCYTAGDAEGAARFLTAAAERLRVQGRLSLLVHTLAVRAHSALLTADLQTAVTAADECCRLAEETRQTVWLAVGRVAAAEVHALRGDVDTAESLLVEADRVLRPRRVGSMLSVIESVRGLALLTAGRPADAYEHLRRCLDLAGVAGNHRESFRAIGALAEAAVLSGHAPEVPALLAPLERAAQICPAPKLHIGLAYARAVLGADDAAEPLYRDALALTTESWPLDRARLQLAYGAWLRRRRRARDSRAPLRAAADVFAALGLERWAGRAHQELRASGETRAPRGATAWTTLSPQELQIARMAAEGLSNGEIGARLFLSHRTVGSHLYRAFPKLGITARAQLRDALGDLGRFSHLTEANPAFAG